MEDAQGRPLPSLGARLVLVEIQYDHHGWIWLYLQDTATGTVYQVVLYSAAVPIYPGEGGSS